MAVRKLEVAALKQTESAHKSNTNTVLFDLKGTCSLTVTL